MVNIQVISFMHKTLFLRLFKHVCLLAERCILVTYPIQALQLETLRTLSQSLVSQRSGPKVKTSGTDETIDCVTRPCDSGLNTTQS